MPQDKPIFMAMVSGNEEYHPNTWTVRVDIEPYERVLALERSVLTRSG